MSAKLSENFRASGYRDLATAISDQHHLDPVLVELALEVAQGLLAAGLVRSTTGWRVNHRPNSSVQLTPGRDYGPLPCSQNEWTDYKPDPALSPRSKVLLDRSLPSSKAPCDGAATYRLDLYSVTPTHDVVGSLSSAESASVDDRDYQPQLDTGPVAHGHAAARRGPGERSEQVF